MVCIIWRRRWIRGLQMMVKKNAPLWQAKQLRMLYFIKVRKPFMPNCLLCLQSLPFSHIICLLALSYCRHFLFTVEWSVNQHPVYFSMTDLFKSIEFTNILLRTTTVISLWILVPLLITRSAQHINNNQSMRYEKNYENSMSKWTQSPGIMM